MRYLDVNMSSVVEYVDSQRRISRKGFLMLKRIFVLCCVTVLVAALSSCIFDAGTTEKPPVVVNTQKKLNLSVKEHVLNNIEYAYNKKDVNTYTELLDPSFTFFYTESDANGHTPVQWGFQDEIKTTSGVFGAALSISMDLQWEDGVTWSTVVSGSEEWQTTTVFYHFTIKIGDTTFIPNAGSKAQFTLRNAGTDEKPHWQLVEFRDLGDGT